MRPRQTNLPRQWLITDERLGPRLLAAVRGMPRGSGVLVRHHELPKGDRARLIRRIRRLSRHRGLYVADEADGRVIRVHDAREIRQAAVARARILLLSPLFPTTSHPDWRPLPRMRAAALARLARVPVLALGGMDERRFRKVEQLGFAGWAAIDAWRLSRASDRP